MMMRYALAMALALLAACDNGSPAPAITYPGIDGHSRFFQLAGTVHDPSAAGSGVTCEGCHPGTTFTMVTCTGCHTNAGPAGNPLVNTNAIHAGVPPQIVNGVSVSYAYDTATCLRCHADGTVPHIKFPIGTGSKHNRLCSQCHSDPTARTDLTKLQCVSCHCPPSAGSATPNCANTQPAPLTRSIFAGHTQGANNAFTFDPDPGSSTVKPFAATDAQWCLRCHDNAAVNTLASHGRRGAPVGYGEAGCRTSGCSAGPGDGNHNNACFKCHAAKPPAFGGTAASVGNGPWAEDWTPAALSCVECHAGSL